MTLREIEQQIGNTPIQRLGETNLYVKMESCNKAGSIKDRAALFMIKGAIEKGRIKEGGTFIEPTSGNTGIGIAYICQMLGYKAIIVMPKGVTKERIAIIESYGGRVEIAEGDGIKSAIDLAKRLSLKIENSLILAQFENEDNALAHQRTTAPEIDRYFKGDVDVLVAGVGTGGTVTGLGRYFKKQSKNKIIIGATASKSAILNNGVGEHHKIFGIGSDIIPPVLDRSVVDMILPVTEEEAYQGVKELYQKYGLKLGVSTGATYVIAKKASLVYPKKKVVFISADGADRYASLNLYD
ncbi:MAG: cysteine synthase family protein [Clostridia bacterium]|nr:cysteine synthase family protein [Clostridia bacterium]